MIKITTALFKKLPKRSDHQRGYILVAVLWVSIVLTIIAFALLSGGSDQYTLASVNLYSTNALYTAEAGIEQTISQLNLNGSFTGYSTAQTFFSSSAQGTGTYTSTITNVTGSNAKTITATGIVTRYKVTSPVASRTIKVTVVGTGATSDSVFSGPGGLILSGSANITNGPVYINGLLNMSGAAQIGTNSQPLSVNIANDACPTGSNPGSTYPTVCTSGQPITASGSPTIYGSVCATGQTSSTYIKTGNGGQGLETGCTAPVVSTPTYNRLAQISAVTTTASGSSNTYTCQQWPFNRTWPANLELTGDVTIGSSCNLDVMGNVYITGSLNIGGAATITVDNSAGTTAPVIIVDGTITVGGSAAMVANSSGVGIDFISFDSTASCTTSTSATTYCATLSGNNLYNSSQLQTVNIGGAVSLPGMIFQAYWGELLLGGSGHIGAVAAQTINMSGAGTIVFGTTLSSGTSTWTISSYQQVPAGL
jgi:Tfp pilus assembly protein PilX